MSGALTCPSCQRPLPFTARWCGEWCAYEDGDEIVCPCGRLCVVEVDGSEDADGLGVATVRS